MTKCVALKKQYPFTTTISIHTDGQLANKMILASERVTQNYVSDKLTLITIKLQFLVYFSTNV